MKVNMEERLPQVVEDRLKEAYEQIRRGEILTGRHPVKREKRTEEKGKPGVSAEVWVPRQQCLRW